MRIEELSLEHEKAFLNSPFAGLKDSMILGRMLGDSAQFRKFVKESEKQRLDWRPGPNKISTTRYVLLDADGNVRALGMMRFPLDEASELDGGNLRCEVPVESRGRGAGSMCLALLLFEAVRAGLRRVLVTCPASDQAARRVFEKNRGQLEKIVKGPDQDIARYWINFSA